MSEEWYKEAVIYQVKIEKQNPRHESQLSTFLISSPDLPFLLQRHQEHRLGRSQRHHFQGRLSQRIGRGYCMDITKYVPLSSFLPHLKASTSIKKNYKTLSVWQNAPFLLLYHNCQTSNIRSEQKSTNPLRQTWATTSQITS